MNIDFNVNNVTELKKVLSYVEKYHDNIVIVIENDEYECLRVYYDENCQNYNLNVIDLSSYLTVNDFIVESVTEIESLIVEAYDLR